MACCDVRKLLISINKRNLSFLLSRSSHVFVIIRAECWLWQRWDVSQWWSWWVIVTTGPLNQGWLVWSEVTPGGSTTASSQQAPGIMVVTRHHITTHTSAEVLSLSYRTAVHEWLDIAQSVSTCVRDGREEGGGRRGWGVEWSDTPGNISSFLLSFSPQQNSRLDCPAESTEQSWGWRKWFLWFIFCQLHLCPSVSVEQRKSLVISRTVIRQLIATAGGFWGGQTWQVRGLVDRRSAGLISGDYGHLLTARVMEGYSSVQSSPADWLVTAVLITLSLSY